ncbi:mechanosensitive ion channel [Hymenobacter sp. RP-2-7]|uniref:Mechanosensitive ion channel n=1 Tax=Hymenobacter polaris TaxID=2682546 RepID=A0A7Y0AFR3_9BACT|nr:mechanosensitive ion channel domain-containing protein [Hymenobacter polaris]NML66487.1 mechanosensitive ion channel [Hymenobacter polaris]
MPAPITPISLTQFDTYTERLKGLVALYLPRIALALVILVIGWYVIGWLSRLVSVAVEKVDVSLRSFLTSLFSIALKVLLLISVAGMVGFQTTSFVAILGAAGLAVGLALQGTLANFAGGVLILLFKPYTVGDVIASQGNTGTVQAIQIFNTILLTASGDMVILPNGATSNNVIVNKAHPKRTLVEIALEFDANTDLDALRQQTLPLLARDPDALPDPAPMAVVTALKPGATMTVAFRVYTQSGSEDLVHNRLMNQLQKLFSRGTAAVPAA